MILQNLREKGFKSALYWDLAELGTGVGLVAFLWMHMMFVSSIILGDFIFNNVPILLEEFYLAQFGIPMTVLLIIVHMVLAGRRIPTGLLKMKIVLKHSGMVKHKDTWTWVFQVITGAVIGLLGAAHVWTVVSHWTINHTVSAGRVQQSPYMFFYLLLLFVGELHASIGLYRIFIKWGVYDRKKVEKIIHIITAVILLLGIGALIKFNALSLP